MNMQTFLSRFVTAIASSLLLAACAISSKADSRIGVDISGVNYSDQPITYILSDPNDAGSSGAEPLDPFAAGGAMCCFRLPGTWQPGIKVRIEILDTNRNPVKDEIVDLPPYVDGKPGRLWAVHYQDGSVDVLSSEYGPPHAKWPGKVKGWPVPTVEYRRKLWERDLELKRLDVRDAQQLLAQLKKDPEKSLNESWEFDKKHRSQQIKSFRGPDDPAYKEFLVNWYESSLKAAQQDVDDWMKRKP